MAVRFPTKLVWLIFILGNAVCAKFAPAQTKPSQAIQGVPPGLIGTPINQSASARRDIPAIAKAANGAVVSVIMSDKDGKPVSQGSGFLVSEDGVIVTNYHVISEGTSAVVKLPDGAFYAVDGVLALDKARDVAIIKAHGQNFRTLTLGNSDRIQVGEDVVAIGNPLSLESTVSNGIVSGIRTIEDEGGKFLQVTAAISPGSSGGPLFNMAGEVVGITTLYIKGGENLNFAIPINDAKRLLLPKSSGLQNLPNERDLPLMNTPPSTTDEGLTTQINSPAYQSYRELLKSEDLAFKVSTYTCFDDDQQSKTFMVINAHLLNKQTMEVLTQNFTNGVSKMGGIFEGRLTSFSGDNGLFATLHTQYDNKTNPSHEADVFEWEPDVLSIKTGFGKLAPGEVRFTYEFNMQRSTGRYTEQTVFRNGSPPEGFTVSNTGKCIRIPNTQTPEEAYRSLK